MPAPTPLQLLIVDDNPLFRKSTAGLLQRLSAGELAIREAGDAQEAFACLAAQAVHCILLDYQLPGEDGLHVLKRITAAYPQTAVIMVTGEGDESVAVEAMKAGALDYLVKESFNEHDLYRAIANATERMRLRVELEKHRLDLLQAERQRAMLASVAAACHHLGQPATIILNYLELMNLAEQDPELRKMITECLQAATGIRDILHRLQQVHEFRTIPYLASRRDGPEMLEI